MTSKSPLSRLSELYREGGITEVSRGIYRYLYYSEPSAFIRGVPGRFLGGEPIWERDWDVLCILDGCRTDVFRDVYGDCDEMRSVGSASRTWVRRTFSRKYDLSNVAYVTANPHWHLLNGDRFAYFHVEGIQKVDGVKTVPPEPLTDRAINVWRRRDELGVDKLIVHYMQPHTPFRSRPEWFDREDKGDEFGSYIWKSLERGEISSEDVIEAYRNNLEWVLEDGIDPLVTNCDASIALSADHGNAVGEGGYYGHGMNIPVSVVRDVPWRVVEGVDERTRTPTVESHSSSVDVENQLKALGYKT